MFASDYSRTSKPVIETDGLTKQFGTVAALDDVDICIREGEFVAIMGPSGSGKTTLLNILSCLDTPSAGTYRLDGLDVSTLTEPERAVIRREKIGLVFQQFHLIPYLTALENVMLAQHYHSVADADEAMEILQSVGLSARASHLPSQLSGGEQQRVCIARALVNEPAIILADEPTGNLDEENEKLIIELLQRLHEDGRTIALVTHNPEMGALADRTIRLRHGKLDG
ncbi:ABC transporter ATP-binding protein [Rhodobium orientis]|uniref:ABC transporter ATP-binding protein n=2 Tax=Rhodobium orientis TaxID=34017 RepID=A0A327JK22_9HYPH|nr:ABC transporter ATP-binding protein [Rhodobium orientis]RAI25986.1 ABC transporter ATP-binding protein [Rhodobium orientis]